MHTICLKNPVPFSLLKVKPKKWIYVGTNYQHTLQIAKQLHPYNIEQFTINKLFYEISQIHKIKVNNFLASLSKKYVHLTHWTTELSNRNAKTCQLMNELFLLLTIDSLIKSADEPLLIIIESAEIFKIIEKKCNSSMQFFDVEVNNKINETSYLTALYERTKYVVQQLQKKEKVNRLLPQTPITLIGIWFNDGALHDENPFETYCGMLEEYLSLEDSPIFYMGYTENCAGHKLLKENLAHHFSNILFPEDWQTFKDILSAALLPLLHITRYKNIQFDEYDITSLLNKQQKQEFSNPGNSSYLSLYYFFKNLKKRNVKIERFIYPFENHPWEKVCIRALRTFFPQTKIIGFQHTPAPQFMLGYTPTSDELLNMPYPDTIVTCGKNSYNALKKGWEPTVKVLEGCTLRYAPLSSEKQNFCHHSANTCGVLFSKNNSTNRELFDVILESSQQLPNHNFLIMLHPSKDNDAIIEDFIALKHENISFFTGSIDDFLNYISILIISCSDFCIKAMLKEIPTICFCGMGKLDMNPQEDPSIEQRFFDSPSLCSKIISFNEQKSDISTFSLKKFFNPLEDKYLKNFTLY
ncbi:hypothetical protein KDK77_08390 [bacterium]|nr:hypothetical protein [bacterium]MCP5462924.1 hypothetical protein [bacterium]